MAQEPSTIRKTVQRENITCTGCGIDKDYHIGETIPGTFGTAYTDSGDAQDWYAHSDACVLPAVKAARSGPESETDGQITKPRRGRRPKSVAPEIPSEPPVLEAVGN